MYITLYLIFVQVGYVLIRSNIRIASYITIVCFLITDGRFVTAFMTIALWPKEVGTRVVGTPNRIIK